MRLQLQTPPEECPNKENETGIMNQKIYKAGRSWQNGIKGGTTIPIVCQWSGWNFLVCEALMYLSLLQLHWLHVATWRRPRARQRCLEIVSWLPRRAELEAIAGLHVCWWPWLELTNETGEHRMRSNGRDTGKKMRKEYTLASTCKYHMTGENSKGNFLSGSIQTNITKSSSGKQHCTAGKKRKEE